MSTPVIGKYFVKISMEILHQPGHDCPKTVLFQKSTGLPWAFFFSLKTFHFLSASAFWEKPLWDMFCKKKNQVVLLNILLGHMNVGTQSDNWGKEVAERKLSW